MSCPSNLQRRIVVALDASIHYGRGVVEGIVAYSRGVGNWTLELHTRGVQRYQALARRSDIAGLMLAWTAGESTDHAPHLLINVGDSSGREAMPTICVDNHRIGQLAAEHLLERGFQRFAGFVHPSHEGSGDRYAGFARTVEAAGYRCQRYVGAFSHRHLAEWLARRHRPLGIMAFADGPALQLAEAAWSLGITVPEELAIVGVDNDPLVSESGHVPLSSVALPLHQIGYEAARQLDAWIEAGVQPPGDRSLFQQLPPTGVVVRASSDAWVTGDQKVAAALTMIRQQLGSDMTVANVAEAVGLGRRQLERRFKLQVGRTVNQIITRARMDRSRMLLATTEDPVAAIGRTCGFGSTSYFCKVFREHTGQSPSDYRRTLVGRRAS